MSENSDNNEKRLRDLLGKITDQDLSTLSNEADLIQYLALDSLAGLKMLARIEKEFDMEFPTEKLANLRTIKNILAELN